MRLSAAPAPDFDPVVVIREGLLSAGSVFVNP
jgi:hypothetical protein